jgi:hypothetical protein
LNWLGNGFGLSINSKNQKVIIMGEYIYKVTGKKKTIGGLTIHETNFLGKPSSYSALDPDKHPWGIKIRGEKTIDPTYIVIGDFDENYSSEVYQIDAGSNVFSDYSYRYDKKILIGTVQKMGKRWTLRFNKRYVELLGVSKELRKTQEWNDYLCDGYVYRLYDWLRELPNVSETESKQIIDLAVRGL